MLPYIAYIRILWGQLWDVMRFFFFCSPNIPLVFSTQPNMKSQWQGWVTGHLFTVLWGHRSHPRSVGTKSSGALLSVQDWDIFSAQITQHLGLPVTLTHWPVRGFTGFHRWKFDAEFLLAMHHIRFFCRRFGSAGWWPPWFRSWMRNWRRLYRRPPSKMRSDWIW